MNLYEDSREWPRSEVSKFIPEHDAPFIIVDRFKQKGFQSATGEVNEGEGYALVSRSSASPTVLLHHWGSP